MRKLRWTDNNGMFYSFMVEFITEDMRKNWEFVDGEPDTYGCRVSSGGRHTVSYGSSSPAIRRVNWLN